MGHYTGILACSPCSALPTPSPPTAAPFACKPWRGDWACRSSLRYSCCAWMSAAACFRDLATPPTRVLQLRIRGFGISLRRTRKQNSNIGFVFAFQVLPVVIFICALFAILYYVGIMQLIIRGAAWADDADHGRQRRRVAQRRRQHFHGPDRSAGDHPPVPARPDPL